MRFSTFLVYSSIFSNFHVSVVPYAVCCVLWCGERVWFLGGRIGKVEVSAETGRCVSLPGDRGLFVLTLPNALTDNVDALTFVGLVRLPSTGIFVSWYCLTVLNFVLIISGRLRFIGYSTRLHRCCSLHANRPTSIPYQRRVRWPTNVPQPSCSRAARHASTNAASSIHAKFHQ